MNIEYHPLAASDLKSAVTYYNNQRSGLGDDLRTEVYAAIERIRDNPFQYAIVEHGVRRSFVRRFPYSILFRITNDAIRVLAIRHHRRHPRFGLGRG